MFGIIISPFQGLGFVAVQVRRASPYASILRPFMAVIDFSVLIFFTAKDCILCSYHSWCNVFERLALKGRNTSAKGEALRSKQITKCKSPERAQSKHWTIVRKKLHPYRVQHPAF